MRQKIDLMEATPVDKHGVPKTSKMFKAKDGNSARLLQHIHGSVVTYEQLRHLYYLADAHDWELQIDGICVVP